MIKIKFIRKSVHGKSGEERQVTDRAANYFHTLGLVENPFLEKEEKQVPETKEEKQTFETKEEKQNVETKEEKIEIKKVKLTKAPVDEVKKEAPKEIQKAKAKSKPKAKLTKAPKDL
jgi:hypothetical protein